MTESVQISVVVFVLLSFAISLLCSDSLQKSNKKHMIAGCFVLGAAMIHAGVIILNFK
tara:strand:- start:512 stop:685 length:174 start_codon:yes stop_codon:yes gene_type:complete